MPPVISITIATPTLAPLVIPSIDGPARGLRKVVCNSRPETARLAPQSVAVMVWGTRDSITMYRQLSFATSPPVSAFHTSMAGMETEPMSRLRIIRNESTTRLTPTPSLRERGTNRKRNQDFFLFPVSSSVINGANAIDYLVIPPIFSREGVGVSLL